MILAVDIGNTNIVIGGIDKEKIYFVERISSNLNKTELEYAIYFKTIMELYQIDPGKIEGGIISSVVPPLSNIIKAAMEKLIDKPILVIGPGVKTGLNIQSDNPEQLGADLVVDAVAATNEYGCPLIIIDMGTVTTFSSIDKNGSYIGGSFVPGVKLSLDSLAGRTSQLPSISIEAPKKVIGRNTKERMRSGAVYGNAALIDGMIDRIQEEMGGEPVSVIATGGLARHILPFCVHEIIYDENLLLKGLRIIYYKNRR